MGSLTGVVASKSVTEDEQEGDAVIIFGDELPVSELSDKLKTIPYEILTSISPRVKRVGILPKTWLSGSTSVCLW